METVCFFEMLILTGKKDTLSIIKAEDVDVGDTVFAQNAGIDLQVHTALQHTRPT
jgi:hypothetical protein